MNEEIDTNALEASLENMLGGTPEPEEREEEAAPAEATMEQQEAEPTEQEGQQEAPEPEFTIEVDGQVQVIKGNDQIKELLQKGSHYHKNSEVNARTRESLQAQAQIIESQHRFQQQVMGDFAQLQAIDSRLQEFNKVDFASLFDQDFSAALKVKEQRDQLREARGALVQKIQAQEAQFKQAQEAATAQFEQAERAALLSKLPAWRDSQKESAEQKAISETLLAHGFTPAELRMVKDHRYVTVARDAMLWRQLQQSKDTKLKQVRTAPPVVKPGAATTQNGKVGFAKATQTLRSLGRQGNNRGQEALVTKMLNGAFKA